MKKHADKNAPLRVVLAAYLDAINTMKKMVVLCRKHWVSKQLNTFNEDK